uniref:J domain-containing protein n=1 Tax=Guillardia theta TaxID=55529 RepID=A0A7S4J7L2_GUITH
MSKTADQKKSLDFYKILGVPKGAGDGQIKSAYRKLAIQYHPDKTAGDAELEERFKEISAAYAVLSDPQKRRQYDMLGDAAVDIEAVDMEQMTFGTTLVAALFSKLGAPIPTAIPQRTLDLAASFEARQQGEKITWNSTTEGKISTHGVKFYFGEVTEEEAKRGVRIYVHSSISSKFKLLSFDAQGKLLSQEESMQEVLGRSGTFACIYMCAFKSLHVDPPTSRFKLVHDEEEAPPVFRRLETLTASRYSPLRPGEVLFAVQGDNFFREVKYTIHFNVCDLEAKEEILSAEEKLSQKQRELHQLEQEYWEAKSKYEKILARVEEETTTVEQSLLLREALYAKMAGDVQRERAVEQAIARAEEERAKEKAKKEAKR